MIDVQIRFADGSIYDAKVEVGDAEIVLHSRSGAGTKARNKDYRAALQSILARLAAANIKPDVYLDSQPVRHLPLNQRQIATGTQLVGPLDEQFNFLIRAMNAGSSSHGAWRRILLNVPNVPAGRLIQIIEAEANEHDETSVAREARTKAANRLSTSEQRKVSAKNVHDAVQRLVAGDDAPNFADSRDYDLIAPHGTRLAPKKVFGLALEEALGIEAFPGHFSAGWSQPCFQILQDAGYHIVKKSTMPAPADDAVQEALKALPPDAELLSWVEGDVRISTHLRRERVRKSGASEAKRAAIRKANGGRLACEHCHIDWYAVYPVEIAEGIFDIHHTTPLANMDAQDETTLDDLLCLCANCHRAEHRRMALT